MAKSKKKAKLSAFSRFSKQQLIIAGIFILGIGGFGVWKLAFSSAARPSANIVSQVTYAQDQVAGQYNVGKLINDRKSKSIYWQSSKPTGGTGYITNWRSKVAYKGVTVGQYKVCYNFATNIPADIRFTLTESGVNLGGSQDYTQTGVTSNNRYQATCHVFDQAFDNPDLNVTTDLQILNGATLEITESTVYKL